MSKMNLVELIVKLNRENITVLFQPNIRGKFLFDLKLKKGNKVLTQTINLSGLIGDNFNSEAIDSKISSVIEGLIPSFDFRAWEDLFSEGERL